MEELQFLNQKFTNPLSRLVVLLILTDEETKKKFVEGKEYLSTPTAAKELREFIKEEISSDSKIFDELKQCLQNKNSRTES